MNAPYVALALNQGQYTLIDAADYKWLKEINWWCFSPRIHGRQYGYYVLAAVGRKRTLMHRLLMQAVKGQVVDHIDGNPLNNRRENLRFADHSENMANRSRFVSKTGFKGVREVNGRFIATISWRNNRHYLGTFKTAQDASNAYDKAAELLHGEFAKTNAEILEKKLPGMRA